MFFEPELTDPEWCDRCFFGKSLWAGQHICDYHYYWWVHQYFGKTVETSSGMLVTNNTKLPRKTPPKRLNKN